jgi:hypothetical protein
MGARGASGLAALDLFEAIGNPGILSVEICDRIISARHEKSLYKDQDPPELVTIECSQL